MKRLALMGLLILSLSVSPGCASWRWPWRQAASEPTAETTAALGERLAGDVEAAASALQDARFGAIASADAIQGAYQAALTVPAASAWAPRLGESAEGLFGVVVPKIEEALTRLDSLRAGAGEVEAVAEGLDRMAAERNAALAEAKKWKDEAKSGVRRRLTLIAVGALLGGLGGIPVFVWLSRRWGIVLAMAGAVVFAATVAVQRWLDWIEWGGLAVLVACVGLLAWAVWRNRKAFTEVVAGGEDVKATLQDLVANYKPDQLVTMLSSFPKGVRDWFNQIQADAQSAATVKMVQEAKDGNPQA